LLSAVWREGDSERALCTCPHIIVPRNAYTYCSFSSHSKPFR
jgi:hypothetical protein